MWMGVTVRARSGLWTKPNGGPFKKERERERERGRERLKERII